MAKKLNNTGLKIAGSLLIGFAGETFFSFCRLKFLRRVPFTLKSLWPIFSIELDPELEL